MKRIGNSRRTGVEDVLVVLAGVGTPLIGMMEEPRVRAAALERHLERPDRQVSVVDRADRPADDEAQIQIENRRQIEFAALADDELGGVASYYNEVRSHASLKGHTPSTFAGGHMVARAELNNVRWVSHCRDLVQLPVAA